MVQKVKVNVKERFYEGQIDLSMSDLDDVPVKEIAAIKKTHSLDLSNNRLTALPATFSSLTFLTKLDLSKNGLTELPEDFGNLIKLRYLDLYSNKLDHLPLSLGQLTALRFLDLKDNPLMPAIAKVAGPCVDNKGCQQCARDVVQFYRKLQEEVKSEVEMRNKERQKQLEINQKKKQEEKKKQKKNKVSKSSKAETVKTEESVGKNIVKKVANKKEKQPLKRQNHIFGYLSLVLVLTIVLWFLFALYPPISNFGPTINNFYQTNVISRLPTDYRNYGLHVGDFIRLSQIRTKNATISLFGKVVESEIYKTVAKKVEYLLASKK